MLVVDDLVTPDTNIFLEALSSGVAPFALPFVSCNPVRFFAVGINLLLGTNNGSMEI